MAANESASRDSTSGTATVVVADASKSNKMRIIGFSFILLSYFSLIFTEESTDDVFFSFRAPLSPSILSGDTTLSNFDLSVTLPNGFLSVPIKYYISKPLNTAYLNLVEQSLLFPWITGCITTVKYRQEIVLSYVRSLYNIFTLKRFMLPLLEVLFELKGRSRVGLEMAGLWLYNGFVPDTSSSSLFYLAFVIHIWDMMMRPGRDTYKKLLKGASAKGQTVTKGVHYKKTSVSGESLVIFMMRLFLYKMLPIIIHNSLTHGLAYVFSLFNNDELSYLMLTFTGYSIDSEAMVFYIPKLFNLLFEVGCEEWFDLRFCALWMSSYYILTFSVHSWKCLGQSKSSKSGAVKATTLSLATSFQVALSCSVLGPTLLSFVFAYFSHFYMFPDVQSNIIYFHCGNFSRFLKIITLIMAQKDSLALAHQKYFILKKRISSILPVAATCLGPLVQKFKKKTHGEKFEKPLVKTGYFLQPSPFEDFNFRSSLTNPSFVNTQLFDQNKDFYKPSSTTIPPIASFTSSNAVFGTAKKLPTAFARRLATSEVITTTKHTTFLILSAFIFI